MCDLRRYGARCCLALAGVLLASCGGGSGTVTSGSRQFGPLELALSSSMPEYQFGQSVSLTLVVTNLSSKAVTTVGGGCHTMFTVTQNGSVVGPEGRNCGEAGFTNTIQPGQSLTLADAWDQKDLNGNQVPAGEYTIRYWYNVGMVGDISLTPDQIPVEMAANPVVITIR